MKKIIPLILSAVMFIAGFAIFFYPKAVNYIYDREIQQQQEKYLKKPENNPSLEALYEMMRKYNLDLHEKKQNKLVDPFSYSQANLDLSDYGIDDNCVGFIIIDKINISLPIYLGANNENMKNGAVHLTETSFPIGGNNTNAVIAAHRGMTKIMFRYIHQLEKGDAVIIKNFMETLEYTVCEIRIISPTDIQELLIQEGRDLVTLISCDPLGKNYQRYVVYCERKAG